MTAPSSSMPSGDIQFFDAFEPGLKDGTYRIDVTHTLDAPSASVPPVAQSFVVQGPRFEIPDDDIHSRFPPNGATSTFDGILPHLVVKKRLLPWERDVPKLDDNVPWLALLVFQQGELLGDPGPGNYTIQQPVQQLTVKDPELRKPEFTENSLSKEELAANCQTITFASELFAQIVPTARELPYLAHARQLNTGAKALLGLKDDGWFSVMVANRFPRTGTPTAAAKCIVHLVSLEGFGDLLKGNAPTKPSQPKVQMVSLATWTFSCLSDPAQTFGGLAQNLAYDSNDAWRPAEAQLLRLPFPDSGEKDDASIAARTRLNSGYVALGYHASSGEDGFAWYRGPLTPAIANPVPRGAGFASADAAIVYDPRTGVFDHSLSAAWQAGRALALGSQPFATALMRVRLKASTLLEQLSAPPTADIHAQLVALLAGGALQKIGEVAAAGNVAPVPKAPRQPKLAAAPLKSLHTLLAAPHVQGQLAAKINDDPDAIAVTNWLGQLLLLRNVPFVHLVPDARMLPVESIRFFYVDPNWLNALIDGALSVGLGTSRDSAVQAALTQKLQEMAATASRAWRVREQNPDATPLPAPTGPISGFVLRSALVSGWPGLVVTGTSNQTPVPLLRVEDLGPNVLICIFNGVPDTITLNEPQEGLEFGVDDFGRIDTRTVAARVITSGPKVDVYNPRTPETKTAAIRDGGQRVLNLSSDPASPSAIPTTPVDLLGLLAKTLQVAPNAIGPARFAVQMVKGPEQLKLSLQPEPKPTPTKS